MTDPTETSLLTDEEIYQLVNELYNLTKDQSNLDYNHGQIKRLCIYLLDSPSSILSVSVVIDIYEIYIKSLLYNEQYSTVLSILTAPPKDETTSTSNNNKSKSKSANTVTVIKPSQRLEERVQDQLTTARFLRLKAYAFYRLGNYSNVISLITTSFPTVLRSINGSSTGEDTKKENGEDNVLTEKDQITFQLLLGQSYYHIGQSTKAYDIFVSLLQDTSADDTEDEEQIQLVTNGIATLVASTIPYTTKSELSSDTSNIIETAMDLLATKIDYPYDLAYNVATFQLLNNNGTSTSSNDRGTNVSLLQTALEFGTQLIRNENGGNDANDEPRIQRELAPLRTNFNVFDTLYWNPNTLVTTRTIQQAVSNLKEDFHPLPKAVRVVQAMNAFIGATTNTTGSTGGTTTNTNTSLSLPTSIKDDLVKILKQDPDEKLLPYQQRIWLYNRAILQYRIGLLSDCLATCQYFLSTLCSVSLSKNPNKSTTTTTSKKKKGSALASATTVTTTTLTTTTTTPVTTTTSSKAAASMLKLQSFDESIWWESRIVVLLAYCHYSEATTKKSKLDETKEEEEADVDTTKTKTKVSNNDTIKSSVESLQSIIQRLNEMAPSSIRDSALLYVQSHYFHFVTNKQQRNKQGNTPTESIQDALQFLTKDIPVSVQSKPAVLATKTSLHYNLGETEKARQILQSYRDDRIVADSAMAQGNYQEAVTLYQKMLQSSTIDDKEKDIVMASYIRALSYTEPVKAVELWNKFCDQIDDVSESDDEVDTIGAELENRELPRSLLKSNRGNVANGEEGVALGSSGPQKKKKSKEAILRQRARRKELYLQKLKEKGTYNPEHPTKPDPERWLPKYERSYNRRRRNNAANKSGQVHKGAQGGISDKDAFKLDVVARQQARAEDSATTTRSTAHMTVVGGPSYGTSTTSGNRKGKGNRKR